MEASQSDAALGRLAGVFLRLGLTSFGGPAAHIAMMEEEFVRRRQWLTRERFLDLVSATHLIPGPNSTELAIHLGYLRAGWKGFWVAGLCFLLPAVVVVGLLAAVYVSVGALPEASGLMRGVQPVVLAIVLHALFSLGRTAASTARTATVGVGALLLVSAGTGELVVLALAALIGLSLASRTEARRETAPPAGRKAGMVLLGGPAVLSGAITAAPPLVSAAAPYSLAMLFGTMLKTGSVLFGSGYVLLAFLRADYVERLGWLTETQLLDAVAVGQVTPGPVFSTATFVGYLMGGPTGAAVATIAIFLPAFVFVALTVRVLPLLRRSSVLAGMLDAVNAASLALMAHVWWVLLRHAITTWPSAGLTAVCTLVLVTGRVNSSWLVLAGALLGLAGLLG